MLFVQADNTVSAYEYAPVRAPLLSITLHNVLGSRRGSLLRCLLFLVPAEPLIFVEVALVDELASSIQKVLSGQGSDQPEKGTRNELNECLSHAPVVMHTSNL